MNSVDARGRAAEVAREAYRRLVAMLSARTGDIIAAEDALADAFAQALVKWPLEGVPARPDAWLYTVARNKQRDGHRREARRPRAIEAETETLVAPELEPSMMQEDRRLDLMFVCAHPSIAPNIRAPLMMQTVLGLEARDIAPAFLLSSTALAQRLVRAKKKIKAAAIPFAVPEAGERAQRLGAVLEAIYGAYSLDWFASRPARDDGPLRNEATFLASLLARWLPNEAEALGLHALLLFSEARRPARDASESFTPLSEQDMSLWDPKAIAAGVGTLTRAHELGALGRFQLEAAIQSVHCLREPGQPPDWSAISQLYAGLLQMAPTAGAVVGYAAALGHAVGAEQGLAALERLDAELARVFQPAWATRAHLLAKLGRRTDADTAFRRAIDLCTEPPVRAYLEQQRCRLFDA